MLSAKTLNVRSEEDTTTKVRTLAMDFKGGAAEGKLVLGPVQMTVVEVGGTAWFQGNDAWFAQLGARAGAARARVGHHWILLDPRNRKVKPLFDLVSRRKLFAKTFDTTKHLRTTRPRTVDGIDCSGVSNGDQTLYVDRHTGRPVSVENSDGSEDSTYTYGAVAQPVAPDPADVVRMAAAAVPA